MISRRVEHQVLEEMSKTGFADFLVLGAHVIPDIDGDYGRLVIFMHDQS